MRKKTKLVCGVGINNADYVVQINESWYEDGKQRQRGVWVCPFYSKWRSMLIRCYSSKEHETNPTYKGCSVCDEWLTFSNFKNWMEKQDWEGKEIDKDILYIGNKIYSPETCVFVDRKVNQFLVERGASRGKLLIGVSQHKEGKFIAQCNDGSGKGGYIGLFNTEIEAHKAWLKRKQEVALKLASEQTDTRVAKALIDRYENYVAQEKEIA